MTPIVLDVPGTNTDPQLWSEPGRWRGRARPPLPHEPLTVAIVAETVWWLADHELVSAATVDESRVPTLPAEGVSMMLR